MPALPGRTEQSRAQRQDPRLRHLELHRMHRLERLRGGLGHAGEKRRFHRADRHAIERPGTRDGLRPGRGAASRRAARAGQGRAGRHRPDRHRLRHRRFAIDPGRRGDGHPRLADPRRVAEGACGRQARGRGRRPRDRRRHGAHRRNGPRHILCRDRRPSRRDGGEIDGGRIVHAVERDLSERHPRLRGRDRSRNRRDDDRPLLRSSTTSASR